jgi:site-specific recombinase XerD
MAQYQRRVKAGLRWFYKFNFQGVTHRSQCIYLTKTEANRAERKKHDELDQKLRNPDLQADFGLLEAINERLDYVKVKKSKSYYRDNIRYLNILYKQLGNIPLTKVSKAAIEDLLLDKSNSQQDIERDNYVVNAMLRLYKALFGYIIGKHNLTLKNPCDSIEFFSVTKKLKYIPSDNDIQAVLELCDEEQKLLIKTVRDTGARINEALRMWGKDILEQNIVLYTRKSNNSDLVPRKVPKPDYFNMITIQSDERLFKRWSDVPRFLEDKVRELEQQNWSWHNLRHRFTSKLSKEGKPLFEIMMLLGHSNLKTTQNYLQLLP